MQFLQAEKLFKRDCQIRGLKTKTITDYVESLQYFQNYAKITDVNLLSANLLEEYILYLHSQPISKATVATYLRPLKVFIKWLEAQIYIDPDLKCSSSIRIPKSPARKVQILNADQLHSLFGNIDPNDILSVRNALILALMLDSGLRRHEVITLEIKNLNMAGGTIKVLGKGDKERIVPIGKFTQQLILLYTRLSASLRDSSLDKKYLILDRYGGCLTDNAVKLLISKLRQKYGFNISAHKLRHNFATNYCLDEYARCGSMDIYKLQAIMGHSNIETTMVYMHLAQEIVAATSAVSHLDQIEIRL